MTFFGLRSSPSDPVLHKPLLFSNLQQNLQDKTQTKEVYGGLDRMDWNAVRKKSHNGAYKKQLNPHRVLAGVRQATPEVYDHSYWNV